MSRYVVSKPLAVDVEDSLVTRGASEWLSRCLTNRGDRKTCPSRTTSLLPTITIFVGQKVSQVRLYKSKNDERAYYIALSYCWGGPQSCDDNNGNHGEID